MIGAEILGRQSYGYYYKGEVRRSIFREILCMFGYIEEQTKYQSEKHCGRRQRV